MVHYFSNKRAVSLLIAVLSLFVFGVVTASALTPAGTEIGNQAVAEYKDSNGKNRSVESNIVYVTVKQVAGVQVSPTNDETVRVAPSQTVQYTFPVTNTGNGSDEFGLDLTVSDGEQFIAPAGDVELYRDINGNGVIDAGDPKIDDTVTLGAGETANIIARFRVPSDSIAGENIGLQLQATSTHDPNVSDASGDITFEIVSEGVLNAVLRGESDNGDNRSQVDPGGIITYTVTVTNQGDQPVTDGTVNVSAPDGTERVAGSVKIGSNVAQVDADDKVDLPTVNPGQSVEVTFEVEVEATHPAGTISHAVEIGQGDKTSTSNTVTIRVRQQAGLQLTQQGDNHEQEPTHIGETYAFPYEVTNTGNGTDRIYVDAQDEKGWTVQLYGSDGVTPLQKHNGKYTVGNVEVNETVRFYVKVTVPTNVTSDENGRNEVEVVATSGFDSDVTDNKTSVLKNFIGAGVTVDLVGEGSKNGDPGDVVEYEVTVTNDGPADDLFDLVVDDVPSGYTVEFFDEGGNPISDITVGGGSTETVTVRVTIPNDAVPGLEDPIEVTVTSQNNSSVSDSVELEIEVNEVVAVTLAPNRSGAANRGSFTTYELELRNNGNAEAEVSLAVQDENKKLEYTITGEETLTLAPGASRNVVVRVDVPTQIAVGTVESAQVTVSVGGVVVDSATLTTTVTGGDLQLKKDADTQEAAPGDTIEYTITATNVSVGTVEDIVIYERIPSETTFVSAGAPDGSTIEIAYSTDGGDTWSTEVGAGSVTDVRWNVGALDANTSVQVTLEVQVK